MAALWEMLVGGAIDSTDPAKHADFAGAWNKGAALAQQQEQLQQSKEALKQKQQELEAGKWEKVGKLYELWDKMPDGPAKKTLGTKVIPANLNALNLSQDMNPAVMEMMNSDPQLGTFLTSKAKSGETTQAEIVNATKDPQRFTELVTKLGISTWADEKLLAGTAEKYGPEILKSEGEAAARKASVEAAGMRAGGTQDRFDESKAIDLAKELNKVGVPSMRTAVAKLDKQFDGGIDNWKTGQAIPGISGGDAILPTNRLKGKALAVRMAAQSVGNQIIKMRNGSAVTDSEAARTMAELGFSPTIGEGGTWTGLTWKGKTSPEGFVIGMKNARDMLKATEKVYKNVNPERYEKVIKDVGGVDEGSGDITLFGRTKPASYWKSFLEQHPDDPAAPSIKKALGK